MWATTAPCSRATSPVCIPSVCRRVQSRVSRVFWLTLCALLLVADSSTLITASADTTAKLWDVATGKEYFTFGFDKQGARGCAFSLGGREVVVTVDPFMGEGSSIRIFRMAPDRSERAC